MGVAKLEQDRSALAGSSGNTHARWRRLLIALIAVKLAVMFILAWRARFVMDEFLQLGYGKWLGHGLFETMWPPKAIGFALFYRLSHFVGDDAVAIVLAARMEAALLACGTLYLVYRCAHKLWDDRLQALASVAALLCFSNFIERIFRTIAEPLAVFFGVAALFAIVSRRDERAAPIILSGILSGCAFLATQKAAYLNGALGIALVLDAMIERQVRTAVQRGALLLAGWFISIAAYILIFGGTNPLPVARGLVFGPVDVATQGGDVYGGLRGYVIQTLVRNLILYAFCFAGLFLSLAKFRSMSSPRRIALITTVIVSVLVFAHNQPWPYVFVLALPFLALWITVPFARMRADPGRSRIALLALILAVGLSFARNVQALQFANNSQLKVLADAQAVIDPGELYFDGIGMLPNRPEPSDLWLDRKYVLLTLAQGQGSQAFDVIARKHPKVLIWSYRLEAIRPVIEPLVRDSFVQIAPNTRIAGAKLQPGQIRRFKVPFSATYGLYDGSGQPLLAVLRVNGASASGAVPLAAGSIVELESDAPVPSLLLPRNDYRGRIKPGADDPDLFAEVYS